MTRPPFDVCIIGAGPRGLSVLERITANVRDAAPGTRIRVHMVDPYPAGAGRVWRTDQSELLLMNTVAAQVTLFTDTSVEMAGALSRGPSLHQWASFLTLMGTFEGFSPGLAAEARALGPDSYPTRALYGRYLQWVFIRVVETASERVEIEVHRAEAVRLSEQSDGLQTVALADGRRLTGLSAVVLVQGHVPTALTGTERERGDFAATHRLTYVPPMNPADADLSRVAAGEPVAVCGLGLCFFDYQALLTEGRGGRFVRTGDRLVYEPSGREPVIYAGSRRGVPYHSRGENQKGAYGRHDPLLLTPAKVAELRSSGPLDFRRDLWPMIAKEVETVYYTALVRDNDCGCTAATFRTRYLATPRGSAAEAALLDETGIAAADRWDWDRLSRPFGERHFTDPAEFEGWLLDYLAVDVREGRNGNVFGPLKAALDVLRDLRNEVRLAVDHGGLTGSSYRDHLDRWYTPLNAFLSIGPPVRRMAEMVALIEAGVLHVLGPGTRVHTDAERGRFVAVADGVDGSAVAVTALIEARLPGTGLQDTADPLLRGLLADGGCRPYHLADPSGDGHTSGGLAVTRKPYHVVDAQGRPHPRRFGFGVPTESVHWVTAAGARPGVNSVTLSDADAISLAVLALDPAAASVAVATPRGGSLVH